MFNFGIKAVSFGCGHKRRKCARREQFFYTNRLFIGTRTGIWGDIRFMGEAPEGFSISDLRF
jgi:hypothetical protein